MEIENFKKRDITYSFLAVNFYVILLVLPIFIILHFLYKLIWEAPTITLKFPYWIIFLLGVVLHELIHGFFAMKYSKNGIKSIKLGISWKMLTPYCHCKEPLTIRNYRIVLIAPLIILGIVPAIIGLIWGNNDIYVFGLIFTLAAGGDIIILWKLRKEKEENLAYDSPDKCGCEVFEHI